MKILKMVALYCAVLAGSMVATAANAGLVFQSVPDLSAPPTGGYWCSSCRGYGRAFDTFTLSSDVTIDNVSFVVLRDYGDVLNTVLNNPVNISFWTVGGGGLPGSELYSFDLRPLRFLSFASNPGTDTRTIDGNIAPVFLAAGTYDISLYNSFDMGVPGMGGGTGLYYQGQLGQGQNGFHPGESIGFALYSDSPGGIGPIPEPATWAMMIIGFGAAGSMIRRRKAVVA